jgi:hypothetical protein
VINKSRLLNRFQRPNFAKKLKGKMVLISFVQIDEDGRVLSRNSTAGVVLNADPRNGVTVLEKDTQKKIVLPFSKRSFKPLEKAKYRSQETGEVFRNPDFASYWAVLMPENRIMPAFKAPSVACSSMYGMGTALYGWADKHDDRSYIATKWIIFVHIPIYPIASFRVSNRRTAMTLGYLDNAIVNAVPTSLHKGQVLRSYVITAVCLTTLAIALTR